MVTRLTAVAFLFPLIIAAHAQDQTAISKLKQGQSQEEVQALLGKPVGTATRKGKALWMYPKGEVQFDSEGRSAAHSFAGDKEYKERKDRQAIYAKARAVAAENARLKKIDVNNRRIKEEKQQIAAARERPEIEEYQRKFKRKPGIHPTAQYYGELIIEMDRLPRRNWGPDAMHKILSINRPQRLQQLHDALSRHPYEVLEKTIDTIYYASEMRRNGNLLGGEVASSSPSSIFLVSVASFDHEHAHILARHFERDTLMRQITSIGDSSYGGSFLFASAQLSNIWTYEKGFITEYAQLNADEDVAETIEYLFKQPKKLFDAADEYPTLKRKEELLRRYLEKLYESCTGKDWTLDRQYFLNLHSGKIRYSPPEEEK